MFFDHVCTEDTAMQPLPIAISVYAIKWFINYLTSKNMITVLEVALLLAIIIVPLAPAKRARVK